jgi:hypothetical protein
MSQVVHIRGLGKATRALCNRRLKKVVSIGEYEPRSSFVEVSDSRNLLFDHTLNRSFHDVLQIPKDSVLCSDCKAVAREFVSVSASGRKKFVVVGAA